MRLLAIDPGPVVSAYVVIDVETRRPVEFAKPENRALLDTLWISREKDFQHVVIEMIASYGMPVGAEVFDTCVWIGRFAEAADAIVHCPRPVHLIKRQPVKVHHCHSAKAKDSNIRQALVDRFAPGQPNHGKGTKAAPGFFYGFHSDIWQAMALAVYAADTLDTARTA